MGLPPQPMYHVRISFLHVHTQLSNINCIDRYLDIGNGRFEFLEGSRNNDNICTFLCKLSSNRFAQAFRSTCYKDSLEKKKAKLEVNKSNHSIVQFVFVIYLSIDNKSIWAEPKHFVERVGYCSD